MDKTQQDGLVEGMTDIEKNLAIAGWLYENGASLNQAIALIRDLDGGHANGSLDNMRTMR